jgi:hypothetical protein
MSPAKTIMPGHKKPTKPHFKVDRFLKEEAARIKLQQKIDKERKAKDDLAKQRQAEIDANAQKREQKIKQAQEHKRKAERAQEA